MVIAHGSETTPPARRSTFADLTAGSSLFTESYGEQASMLHELASLEALTRLWLPAAEKYTAVLYTRTDLLYVNAIDVPAVLASGSHVDNREVRSLSCQPGKSAAHASCP
mmetsp:Transcript_25525/g.81907  ORF Transcript_25525/g.81907 Transcript_25525/m.81907 type:complete len:110 (+) Transcript_25525:87-416(+)